MHILDANELFGVTSYTYDRIMEEGGKNGPDAFALYFKLMKQARIQKTNQTFTLNQFLKNFFGWGHERLAKAKNTLKKLGLVDDVLIRADNGKLQGHYIRVNYLVDEQKVRTSALTYTLTDSLENRQSVSTECGQTDANALSTQYINAGSTQNKNICQENEQKSQTSKRWTEVEKENFELFWKTYPHYESRSRKKDAKTHFREKDYNEMMFSAKMLKWKTIMHPDKAEYVPGCHKRVNNFTPMSDYQKKQAERELYMRHMGVGGNMRVRMEEIVRDFPDADFSEFREELSKKKTENAIGSLIHGK